MTQNLSKIESFFRQVNPRIIAGNTPEKPLVSVAVQTYQHAYFIQDCLEGILRQKTNFDFEILIGEDESTDGTREICIEYAERYPDKIRLILHDSEALSPDIKLSPLQINAFYNLFSAKGKYIAFCEGDDYWTDPFKLQKQVDFLEANQQYIIVSGGFISMSPYGHQRHIEKSDHPDGFSFNLQDQSKRWLTKTLTCMFRNKPSVFVELLNYKYGRDVHLFFHLLMHGDGYYMKEVFGVQVRHSGGIFSLKADWENLLTHYEVYKEIYFNTKREEIRSKFVQTLFRYINLKIKQPELLEGIPDKPIFRDALKSLRKKGEIILFLKLIYIYRFRNNKSK